jgi:RHS repeat-associated protein
VYTWNRLDLASVTDREGRTTQYKYDAVQNLTDIINPIGEQTKFEYFEHQLLKTLIDENGNKTRWNRDVQSRVTSKTYADGRQVAQMYEPSTSRVLATVDPIGQMKQYAYTVDDRLAAVNYVATVNPTPNVTFTYDPSFPRRLSMTDGIGTTLYEYHPAGALGALRLARELGPSGESSSVTYQYDALGRVIARGIDVTSEQFAYDELGRMTSHSSPLGTFHLDYLGQTTQPTNRHYVNGLVRTLWSYETNRDDRRLKQIINGAQPRNYLISSSPESLVREVSELGPSPQRWAYKYDANRRLVDASTRQVQYSYSYDAADNIQTFSAPGGQVSAIYNSANQMTALGVHAVVYDKNGNITNDGNRTYSWDAENRLLSVTLNAAPSTRTTFQYDGLNRRVGIVRFSHSATVETRYLWCGVSVCQARNSADDVIRRYYPEGEIAFGVGLYYSQDHLGSVRDVLSVQTGQTLASFDYDPFGNLKGASGNMSTDFRYAGLFYEENTGLYLANYRAYDPRLARWLSPDPLEERGGVNLYAYTGGNPTSYVDPSGLYGLAGAAAGYISGAIGGYVTGGWWGAAVGGVAGAVVGVVAPWESTYAGAAAAGLAASVIGQIIGNVATGKPATNIDPIAAIGAGLGGAAGMELAVGLRLGGNGVSVVSGIGSGVTEWGTSNIPGNPGPQNLSDIYDALFKQPNQCRQ